MEDHIIQTLTPPDEQVVALDPPPQVSPALPPPPPPHLSNRQPEEEEGDHHNYDDNKSPSVRKEEEEEKTRHRSDSLDLTPADLDSFGLPPLNQLTIEDAAFLQNMDDIELDFSHFVKLDDEVFLSAMEDQSGLKPTTRTRREASISSPPHFASSPQFGIFPHAPSQLPTPPTMMFATNNLHQLNGFALAGANPANAAAAAAAAAAAIAANAAAASAAAAAASNEEEDEDYEHNAASLTTADEKQRRRENNKNSARNSRKKKKDYVVVLQDSIQVLTREIAMLRYEVKRRQQQQYEQQQQFGGADPSTHIPRQICVCYTFENLIRVVCPPHMRFLLWNVHKRNSNGGVADAAAEENSAWYKTWQEVSTLLALNSEQNERLALLFKAKKSTDNQASEERDKVAFIFAALTKLRKQYDVLAQQFAVQRQVFHRALAQQQQHARYDRSQAWALCQEFVLSNANESLALRNLLGAPAPNPHREIISTADELRRVDELLSVE